MIERKPHLILATRTDAAVLVLPVAHAFSRRSSHITVLAKTLGKLGRLGRRICGHDNSEEEEQGQDDAKHHEVGVRYHVILSITLRFRLPRRFLSSFQNLFE